MKKKLILLSLLNLALITSVVAQGFDQGVKNLSVGLNGGWGIGIVGMYDVGITPDISVGAQVGFNSGYTRYYYGSGSNGFLSAGVRGSYHFGNILNDAIGNFNTDKNDPYAGIGLGYRGNTYFLSPIYFGGHVGYRYGINDKLGVYAEGGWPFSSIGVTFKM